MSWTVPTPDLVDVNMCAGLDAESPALKPIPSTKLSLLGLVRHLATVERIRPAIDGVTHR